MNKLKNKGIYTISWDYVAAILNNDYSGLSDKDIELCGRFDNEHSRTSWDVKKDCCWFDQCEISGLMGDCVDVELFGY